MSVNDYTKSPLTWMPDPASLSYPQYLSLAASLEHAILSGSLLPGTKLPPQRALADYLDLNFTTVTRAYDLCREKNLIYGITGRGTFVAPHHNTSNADVAELGVVLGFPMIIQPVITATREITMRDSIAELFSYHARSGLDHHRAAGLQWMRHFGTQTDLEHTAVFAGAQNAITVALLSLFHVGDSIAVDAFTYANLIETSRLAHIRLVPILNDAFGMIPEALAMACPKRNIRGIFIMPNCANPTTITIPDTRRDALAAVCEQYNLTVIEDDSATTISNKYQTFFDRLPKQTLYIAASTRHLAPGLRITFAAFPERFRQPLLQGLFHTSIKAGALDAEIISQLIQSGDAQKILAEKHKLALKANQCFDKIFPNALKCSENGAYFRVIPLTTTEGGPVLEQRLLSHGLRVCHSYRFSVEKNPHHTFLRISLSSMPDLATLKQALTSLKSIL